MSWKPILVLVALIGLGALPAAGQPRGAPADQARALLTDYFAAEQRPPARAGRKFDEWMTSRFASLYRQAQAKSRSSEDPYLEADPVLNAQDSDRPGDIRIEQVAGTPERPTVRVSFRVFAGDQARTTQILVFAEDRGEWRLYDILTPQETGEPSSFRQYTERYVGQGRPQRR